VGVTFCRATLAAVLSAAVTLLIMATFTGLPAVLSSLIAMVGGAVVMILVVLPEIRLLLRL
jgi:uncharacterized integral membrane protein